MTRDRRAKRDARDHRSRHGGTHPEARRATAGAVQCRRCRNLTLDPGGLCHLHRNDSAPASDGGAAVPSGMPPALSGGREPEPEIRIAEVLTHTFPSTGEAYDATQIREDVRDGDILHVPSEGVVGYLDSAWPVALTREAGEFHTLNPGSDPRTLAEGRYREVVDRAEELIRAEGLPPWTGRDSEEDRIPDVHPEYPAVMTAKFPDGESAAAFADRIGGGGFRVEEIRRDGAVVIWRPAPDASEMHETDLLETVGHYGSSGSRTARLNGRAAPRSY